MKESKGQRKIENSANRVRILKVWEILQSMTDSNHTIDIPTILSELKKCNIDAERRTLYSDIKALTDFNYPIQEVKKNGCATKYYVSEKNFSEAELRILIDAVQAAKFVPASQTMDLEEKLAKLGGSIENDLTSETIFSNLKYENEEIFHNIEIINQAIKENKYIFYTFLKYDVDGNPSQRFKEKAIPLGLVLKDGDYYLIRYRGKAFAVKGLRVDLLADIKICEQTFGDICDIEDLKDFTLDKFVAQSSDLFSDACRTVAVTIETDKFGTEVKLIPFDDKGIRFTADVQIGNAFYGWLATNSERFKLVAPDSCVRDYQMFLVRALKLSEDIDMTPFQRGVMLSSVKSKFDKNK
jgi:predicted DNA-binding transcriptional regulator YafY